MTTRHKLILLILSVCLSGCVSETLELIEDARTQARIGVLAHAKVGWITETAKLEKAFRFYRQSKVDAVVLTGAVTKDGYRDQFDVLNKVWKKVFDDTSTRLIMSDGQYDVNGFRFAVSSNRPSAKCDVLTFHGGARLALTDELCRFPPDANLVCAGSLSGIDISANYIGSDALSKILANAAQGLLVVAYSPDNVKIRRLDFTQTGPVDVKYRQGATAYVEDVAEPWEPGRPKERPPTPQFWEDTTLRAILEKEASDILYRLAWPTVQKRFTGARARCYEVGVATADEPPKVHALGLVLSEKFHLAEERDTQGASCVIRLSGLGTVFSQQPAIRFAVTPIGEFGKRGAPIFSAPLPTR